MQEIISEDRSKFGIIPELIGRLPVLLLWSSLTVDDLVRIFERVPTETPLLTVPGASIL